MRVVKKVVKAEEELGKCRRSILMHRVGSRLLTLPKHGFPQRTRAAAAGHRTNYDCER
jgi:hypothetical protein